MYQKYIAEGIGTFTLAFVVSSAIVLGSSLPLAVPLIAALIVTLFVYTIGAISGCHINPAITLGLWSVQKITHKDAIGYLFAQFAGAIGALVLAKTLLAVSVPAVVGTFVLSVFFMEALGAFFLAFGVASVVYGNVKSEASGLVIGGSLLLGIMVAALGGAQGILNPAVAVTLNAVTLTYLLAPIVGGIAGFQIYRLVAQKH
jgi:glycerol uptake facilitator-like aquaporin